MTVLAERDTRTPAGASPVTMAAALNRALADALRDDETVLVFGEDVAALGGVFRVTDGLAAAFGEARVFDTPLAESGIVGTAIGMAMNGLRPVVEMQFDAFAYPAFEQITSHLAKLRNRTRGRISLPIVIRVPYGGGIGGVEHHCDSSEAYYTHTAGLRVVTPATPGDAYALLRQAIDCPDPVIFLEPKRRYWSKETTVLDHTASAIDRAVVRRPGTDVTLIAYGGTLRTALDAADRGPGKWPQRRGHRPAKPVPVRRRHRHRLGPADRPGRRDPRGQPVLRIRRRGGRAPVRAVLPLP